MCQLISTSRKTAKSKASRSHNHRARKHGPRSLGTLRPRTHSHPCHRSFTENGSAFGFIISTTSSRKSASLSLQVLMCESQRLRSPILSFRGGSRSRAGEVERFGPRVLEIDLRQSLRVRFYTAPSRIPDPPTVHRAAVSRGEQTRLKSLSCRQPRCTNLRFCCRRSWNPTFAQRTRKDGAPAGGGCPRNQKQDQNQNQNQDQEQRQRTGVSALQGELDLLHFRCLAAHWSPLCCRRSWNPTLRKERAKMGHPGAGVRLKKIKTKITSKTKPRSKARQRTECRSTRTTFPPTHIIERFGSDFELPVGQGKIRAIA